MTIPELFERVEADPKFARAFKALTKKVTRDRKKLIKAGASDTRAVKQFLSSWEKVLAHFADDPRSLAALTAPRLRKLKSPCNADFSRDECFTETMVEFLYDVGQSKGRKRKA